MATGVMTATLAITNGPVIAGSQVDMLLTISNSGGTDYNITSIQGKVSPSSVPGFFSAWTPTIGQTIVVPNGSNIKVPLSFIALGPSSVGTGGASTPYQVSADVLTSNGDLVSPPYQLVSPAFGADSIDSSGGKLRLNSGYNSSNFVAVFL